MSEALARLFRVQGSEIPALLLFAGLMLANSLAMQVSYVASLSGFLKADGLHAIWIVWLIDYGLFLVIAVAQSLIIDRFDRVKFLRAVLIAFSLVFLALWLALQLGTSERLVYAVLYLVAEQQWMLFPLVYWVLANDAWSVAQAKRIFPILAGSGFVGKLIGLALAAAAPAMLRGVGFDVGVLLLFNVATYLAAIALLQALQRRVPLRQVRRRPESARAALSEGAAFIRNVPSFRYLTIALLALMVIDTVIEFHFLVYTDAAFLTQEAYQTFYSLYRMGAVSLAFGVQLFVTRRLLVRVELKDALSVQPFVALVMLTLAIAVPGVGSAVLGLLAFRLVGETFHDTAQKALQGLVPEERRGRVGIVLESYVVAVGTIVGASVIGAVTLLSAAGERFDSALIYLPVAVAAAACAIIAALRMRRDYDASLLNWRLRRRQRTSASVLDDLL